MLLIQNEHNFNVTKTRIGTHTEIWFRNCTNFRARDLTFDGKRTGEGTDKVTVRLENCRDFFFENCFFKRAKWDHFYATMDCINGRLLHCDFDDSWRHGITLVHSRSVVIHDCSIRAYGVGAHNWMTGIRIEPNDKGLELVGNIRISDTNISGGGDYGIACPSGWNSDSTEVTNCQVAENILLHGRHNRVTGCSAHTIAIRGDLCRADLNDILGDQPNALWIAGKGAVQTCNRMVNGGTIKVEQEA